MGCSRTSRVLLSWQRACIRPCIDFRVKGPMWHGLLVGAAARLRRWCEHVQCVSSSPIHAHDLRVQCSPVCMRDSRIVAICNAMFWPACSDRFRVRLQQATHAMFSMRDCKMIVLAFGEFEQCSRAGMCDFDFRCSLCRVEDYWLGYKMFCYAYYSNSAAHESEFRHSKLGSFPAFTPCFDIFVFAFHPSSVHVPQCSRWVGFLRLPNVSVCAGVLVWRRFHVSSNPSHHAVRAACMQLLPLVEMYCKYELQEDCSNLWELMLRFDSEAALQTHGLGRSMLAMLRDEDAGLQILPPSLLLPPMFNPFDAIRTSLAAVDTAFHALRPQVLLAVEIPSSFSISWIFMLPLGTAFCFLLRWHLPQPTECQFLFAHNLQHSDVQFVFYSPCLPLRVALMRPLLSLPSCTCECSQLSSECLPLFYDSRIQLVCTQ